MSGFLGQMLGNLLGGQSQQVQQGLPGILTQLLSGQATGGGGLQGLLGQLTQAGLGQQVQSWIGSGQNMPVTSTELGQALPRDNVQQWAQQAGTTPDNLLGLLSQILPHAVDQATPNGQVPPADSQQFEAGSVVNRLWRV